MIFIQSYGIILLEVENYKPKIRQEKQKNIAIFKCFYYYKIIGFIKKTKGNIVLLMKEKERKSMKKKILLIATGGTIASQQAGNGLAPLICAEEILSYITDVYKVCEPEAVQICNIDSTNMEPQHWKLLVRTIRENYSAYDG